MIYIIFANSVQKNEKNEIYEIFTQGYNCLF